MAMKLRHPLVMGLIVIGTIVGVHAKSARKAVMTIKDPIGTLQKISAAPNLDAKVKLYLRGKHEIASARYFKVHARHGWSQIAQSVSSFRGTLHKRPSNAAPGSVGAFRPSWHKVGDMVDLYVENPPFAVAMQKEPLPDGSKLVGYYDLKAVK